MIIKIFIGIFLLVVAALGALLCYYQNKRFLLIDFTQNRRLGKAMLSAGIALIVIAVIGVGILLFAPLVWNVFSLIAASLIVALVSLGIGNSL